MIRFIISNFESSWLRGSRRQTLTRELVQFAGLLIQLGSTIIQSHVSDKTLFPFVSAAANFTLKTEWRRIDIWSYVINQLWIKLLLIKLDNFIFTWKLRAMNFVLFHEMIIEMPFTDCTIIASRAKQLSFNRLFESRGASYCNQKGKK